MAIVRVREPGLDASGAPIAGAATEATLAGAFTGPRTSEDTDGRARDGAVIGLALFAPTGSDLVRTDLVRVDGDLYRIDGDVAVWENPFTGWEPGITADLVRASG